MAQYFRIATKDFCNTLKPDSFTGDTMMCPTRSQIESAGLHIKKGYTYAADQLVPEDHIERLDWEYTFSVTPATATISAAGGSRKFTVTSYKRQYSYSNAGNRIYVEGSQTNVAYTSENSGSGTWTAANDTVSYSSNPGGAEKMVLLHGPNPNLSVLILRKQLLQLINKMQTLSNRMEMVMAIQESNLSTILQLSRPPEVVRHLVTPMNKLYIGYPEKLRHLHLVELQHLIELQEQQP